MTAVLVGGNNMHLIMQNKFRIKNIATLDAKLSKISKQSHLKNRIT